MSALARIPPALVPGLVVYKIGGPALEDPALIGPLAREIAGTPAVLVHGGGRQVERLLGALAIPSRFVDGRRETSPAAMEVVEMVLSGLVNKALAAGLTAAGVPAVGLSGRDGGMVAAALVPGLGRVGTPVAVDPALLRAAWAAGFVPVVSPVASGPDGGAVNVNADEAALAIAGALGAASLVYLSDVAGVSVDGVPVRTLDAAQIERHCAAGAIAGGMAMKVRTALAACAAGIPSVVIAGPARLDGGFPGTRIGGAA